MILSGIQIFAGFTRSYLSIFFPLELTILGGSTNTHLTLGCKWANTHSVTSLPASHFHVALHLINLSESANSVSKIDEAFYALSWAHKLAGVPDPCKNDLVVSVREGAHRKIGHLIVKKEPITPDILPKIVLLYGNKYCNLKDLRIACMCLLGYAGFLRFSELASFNRSDISFFPSYVKLYLEKSKTDVIEKGGKLLFQKLVPLLVLLTC